MAAVPPTGGPKNAAAPDERWALTLRHYNSRTKRRSSFWNQKAEKGWRATVARRRVVRNFLRFAAVCALRCPVSRHIAVLPQCRIGAFCPPLFRLASLRRHTPRQASWGKRKYSGAAGNLRSVRPLLFGFQRSAVFSFLHTPPLPPRVFFSLPPIHPAASRFLRSNFRKLQRGADASVDLLQTSRFPSAARPPRASRHFELRTS